MGSKRRKNTRSSFILFLKTKLAESFHFAIPICSLTQWDPSLHTAI